MAKWTFPTFGQQSIRNFPVLSQLLCDTWVRNHGIQLVLSRVLSNVMCFANRCSSIIRLKISILYLIRDSTYCHWRWVFGWLRNHGTKQALNGELSNVICLAHICSSLIRLKISIWYPVEMQVTVLLSPLLKWKIPGMMRMFLRYLK